jgi:hypothetical protein
MFKSVEDLIHWLEWLGSELRISVRFVILRTGERKVTVSPELIMKALLLLGESQDLCRLTIQHYIDRSHDVCGITRHFFHGTEH